MQLNHVPKLSLLESHIDTQVPIAKVWIGEAIFPTADFDVLQLTTRDSLDLLLLSLELQEQLYTS